LDELSVLASKKISFFKKVRWVIYNLFSSPQRVLNTIKNELLQR